jgi:hypothetical protein
MRKQREPRNLKQLLARVCAAPPEGSRVTLDSIVRVIGRRSFGPLLLLAGLVMVLPIIGDIPGVPTAMGVFVLLTAGQLLFKREYVWLPQWLLNRSVERTKLSKAVGWLVPPARFIDGFLRRRMTVLSNHAAQYVVAAVCVVIAVTTPAMEIVPLSANIAGAAIAVFGLSLMAHDGALALCALLVTASMFVFVVYKLL